MKLDYFFSEPSSLVHKDFRHLFSREHLGIWLIQSQSFRMKKPINSVEGCVEFVIWILSAKNPKFPTLDTAFLLKKTKYIDSTVSIDINNLMYFVYEARPGLKETFDLSSIDGQRQYVGWWMTNRNHLLGEFDLDDALWSKKLFEDEPTIKQLVNIQITKLMYFVYEARPDLKETFDLSSIDGQRQYVGWFSSDKEIQLIQENMLKKYQNKASLRKIKNKKPLGVNIIGLAQAELGIGEDVRMAALSMNEANIPFVVYNFPKDISSRQEDDTINEWISTELKYSVNIFCLPAIETLRAYYAFGKEVFQDYYNIGYWQWEFDDYLDVVKETAFCIVDEVWAPTNFVAKAVRRINKPTIVMPTAVSVSKLNTKAQRKDFGLPEDKFLFFFAFDGNSSFSRKNPFANIEAFWKAFDKNNNDVALVIKAMNVSKNDTWKEYKERVEQDKRIILIDDMLTRGNILALINACDVFISLHRSEGFGRGLAEAMILKKAVIASSYSGNMDFMNDGNSYLVSGALVQVLAGEYENAEGLSWLSPDINSAAHQMLKCFNDKKVRKEKIIKANKTIEEKYSFSAVGQNYKNRLMEIFEKLEKN